MCQPKPPQLKFREKSNPMDWKKAASLPNKAAPLPVTPEKIEEKTGEIVVTARSAKQLK
jgi:hypothetical protein